MPVLRLKRVTVILIAAALVAAAAILFYCIDPSEFRYAPKCIFYMLTGLECPGCGSQRALHALTHLHVAEAFHYNALLVSALPFLVLYVSASIFRDKVPGLYRRLQGRAVILTTLSLIFAWWVLRNLFQI